MRLFSSRKLFSAILPLSIVTSGLLTGCGASLTSAADGPQPGAEIHGMLHGGQFPISGAQIYLMAANSVTYKGASTSLLNAPTGGATSPIMNSTSGDPLEGDYYVLTAADGTFTIAGDYSCTYGTQVYALAVGGDPTPGTPNAAAVMVALVGSCPTADNFAGTVPYIVINEVSTVAAAYSLAAFAADYADIGASSTAAGTTGLANAFATATNLVNLGSGQAYVTTPGAHGSNGTVPQQKIYALANSVAACVNSGGSGTCTTLFNATSVNGVAPTNVFNAVLNLAQHPAVLTTATSTSPVNTGIYTLAPPNQTFTPSLTTAPTDWTISILYKAVNTSYPARPAIDLSGDLWIPNAGNSTLTELSPVGTPMSGSTGFSGGGLNGPVAVAVDTTVTSGNIWVANLNTSNVSRFSFSGTGGSSFATTATTTANGYYSAMMSGSSPVFAGTTGIFSLTRFGVLASSDTATIYNTSTTVDNLGSIWSSQYTSNTISKLNTTLTGDAYLSSAGAGGLDAPTSLSADSSGNLWVANAGASRISEFVVSGSTVATRTVASSTYFTGGGLLDPYATRIDSAGTLFVGNANGAISVFATGTASGTTAGTVLSSSGGYTTASTAGYNAHPGSTALGIASAYAIVGLAIDQAGNLWAPDLDGSIYEFVGLAGPVAP